MTVSEYWILMMNLSLMKFEQISKFAGFTSFIYKINPLEKLILWIYFYYVILFNVIAIQRESTFIIKVVPTGIKLWYILEMILQSECSQIVES